ncbi:hypothetical protein AVEN_55218-1, partial [Araneus ventricosus]
YGLRDACEFPPRPPHSPSARCAARATTPSPTRRCGELPSTSDSTSRVWALPPIPPALVLELVVPFVG